MGNLIESIEKEMIPSELLNDYWVGPHNVLVPKSIKEVKARDGSNVLSKKGYTTEMNPRLPIPTASEYRQKYAELGPGGYYYWKAQ